MVKSVIYYSIVSSVILTVYGTAICPYIDSLDWFTVLSIFTVTYLVSAGVRLGLEKSIAKADISNIVKTQMTIDLIILAAAGVGLSFFNYLFFDFPIGSGLKVLVSMIVIGFFASLDMAFLREYQLFKSNQLVSKYRIEMDNQEKRQKIFPVTYKIGFYLAIITVTLIIVLSMVLLKDTEFLLTQTEFSKQKAQLLFFVDVFFVILTIVGLAIRSLTSYGRNVKYFFDTQIKTLDKVERGDYFAQVPVNSLDEFGMIASQTNSMIKGLQEKEFLMQKFGKVVSQEVVDLLLRVDFNDLKKGHKQNVTVLFCDLRNFTKFAEENDSERVVSCLNNYFNKAVSIIHKQGGIVDKFMGDALLAVFGIGKQDDDMQTAEAFAAAKELTTLVELEPFSKQPIKNGIGLACGTVIAGAIGSEERYEFTVIGDPVNMASRLETLSKELKVPLVASKQVYDNLSPSEKHNLDFAGKVEVRGKTSLQEVYISKPTDMDSKAS